MENTASPALNQIRPTVSILMLTYNRGHYIEKAIESVLAQTYDDWKLTIIDDGSTDGTASVLAKFTDPRIAYIKHVDNKGLFARRQESLRYATGKYTAILDSDDYWISTDKLQKQVEFLERNSDHVLVGTFTKIVDADDNEIGRDKFMTTDADIKKRLLLRNQFTHSSVVIRSDTLAQTEGYLPTLAEDLDLFLQLGQKGKLTNLPEVFTAYRVHGQSANDRGIKMAQAVHNIIKRRRSDYPWRLAILKSYLRLARGKILQFFA